MTTVLCMVQDTGSSHLGLIISRGMVVAGRAVAILCNRSCGPHACSWRVLINLLQRNTGVCCCMSDECRNGIGAASG